MALVKDLSNKANWGGTEYGGTQDGTPPLSTRLKEAASFNFGGKTFTPPPGCSVLQELSVAPSDGPYGTSTGWRNLSRQSEPITMRNSGDEGFWVWAVLTPAGYPLDADMYLTGMEIHQTNPGGGTGVAPCGFTMYSNGLRVRVWGGSTNASGGIGNPGHANSYDNTFAIVTRDVWHVLCLRFKHGGGTSGVMELWHGETGADSAVSSLTGTISNIATMYGTLNNYELFGLYRNQTGTSTTTIYTAGWKHYSDQSGALAWANTMLGSPGSPAAPTNAIAPVVSGQNTQGNTLVTDTGSWNNVPTSFTYAWQADVGGNGVFSNIGGATSSTFTVTSSQINDSIRCRVTATNATGSATASSNTVAYTVVGPNPNDAIPNGYLAGFYVQSGAALQGSTINSQRAVKVIVTTSGTVTRFGTEREPGAYGIIAGTENIVPVCWNDNGLGTQPGTVRGYGTALNLQATTAAPPLNRFFSDAVSSFTVTAGETIWLGDLTGGTSNLAPTRSNPITGLFRLMNGTTPYANGPVTFAGAGTFNLDLCTWLEGTPTGAGSAPANSAVPTIKAVLSPNVGQTMNVFDLGTWTGTPAPTFAYQWKRNGVAISGATASAYQLVTADLGTTITLTVTATNSNGSASATSLGLGPIAAFLPRIVEQGHTTITRGGGVRRSQGGGGGG